VTSKPERRNSGIASFRTKLLVTMMLVASTVAAAILLFAQLNSAQSVRLGFQREFQNELDALHTVQAVRHAALAERCRVLARKPRIHAALEDGAPDLLYPSARDEMLDVMDTDDSAVREPGAYTLRARYYRFLDGKGRAIAPPDGKDVGVLEPAEEAQLDLGALPDKPQTGYVLRGAGTADETIDEVIAMPIVSTESGEAIAAIVVGFKAPSLGGGSPDAWIQGGIWLGGHLDLPTLGDSARQELAGPLGKAIAASDGDHGGFDFRSGDAPYLVFFKRLNPGSVFPPAYEVSIYPLAASVARERRIIWEFVGAGALLLAGAFLVSHVLSGRLSEPVEKLAVDSEVNREHWHRAEAALETTSQDLQRSARFSADASHQLKTPVTVLRAGLEGLLAGENLGPEAREEVSALVHQTFRLASVIEDLLLLSRMDAGRLQIQFARMDLSPLLEALMDDLGALPDIFDLEVDADIPPSLWINGEKRFAALILQNLLENARKYNHTGGQVRISAHERGEWAVVTIGNTGPPIPQSAQEHVFERFHRGAVGENVPGHGIGLNLARELARLHGGELSLSRSDASWTEFELRFRISRVTP
jgi:signal transduction histidine kinase